MCSQDRLLPQDERESPLAPAVSTRLSAYLDERAVTWPDTSNPHVFANSRSAWRDTAVGHRWVHLNLDPPRRL